LLTGNPVRSNYDNLESLRDEAYSYFDIPRTEMVVLVLGGSLGAGTLNKTVEVSTSALRNTDITWIWQSGKNYLEKVKVVVERENLTNVKVRSFIDRMDLAYAAADIVVSRAGAGTISELCLVGKPVILVPSPNVAEDHQTKNAMSLVANNAAIMLPDNEVAAMLPKVVETLAMDTERRKTLSENIRKLALPGSDRIIAEEILKLAGG
jgi:UDP-N-acetylglucosamine--N-acetylmuramyl-(pentapeptide) pyrophosphoryl-undecaprenol N-acetylglucosamine transferase